jgi:hypothetical protein
MTADSIDWTTPAIRIAAAGVGGAVAGPLGAALGGLLGDALGSSATALIKDYAEKFGEKAAEKLFDSGTDSLVDKLKTPPPQIESVYREALRLSLAEIRTQVRSADFNDWFTNWDRSLTVAAPLDLSSLGPGQFSARSLDAFFRLTLERLDGQGAAIQRNDLSLTMRTRTMPEALISEVTARLPIPLQDHFRALILTPQYELAWKQAQLAFLQSTGLALGRIDETTQRIERKLHELVKKKPAIDLFTGRGTLPAERRKTILAHELQAIGDKYLPQEYVERPIDATCQAFLESESKLLVIVDSAGSGKTSLCCCLAERVVDKRPVVFVSCGQVDSISEEIARQMLELTGHGSDDLPKPLVILDAINEFPEPSVMRNALGLLLKQMSHGTSQYVMTCRDVSWPYYTPYDDQSTLLKQMLFQEKIFPAGSFSSDEAERAICGYFERFGIRGELRGHARTSMAHPLLLRFFCEAYAGEAVGRVTDVFLKDLFETYLSRKRSEIRHRLRLAAPSAVDEFLEALAIALWQAEGLSSPDVFNGVPHGGLNPTHGSLYAQLLETHILVEREHANTTRRVTFKYDAFQDFVTARMLYRRFVPRETHGKGPLGICADRIAQERERPNLETVSGFVFSFCWDSNDVTATELADLCRRGPMYARATIYALRQISVGKLQPAELRFILSLSEQDDPDTHRLASEFVADRYAYLPVQLRDIVKPWIDSGFPGLAGRLIVENFEVSSDTGWDAVDRLIRRDRSQISHGVLLRFAADRVRDRDRSQQLRELLRGLTNSADPQIAREANARLTMLD